MILRLCTHIDSSGDDTHPGVCSETARNSDASSGLTRAAKFGDSASQRLGGRVPGV